MNKIIIAVIALLLGSGSCFTAYASSEADGMGRSLRFEEQKAMLEAMTMYGVACVSKISSAHDYFFTTSRIEAIYENLDKAAKNEVDTLSRVLRKRSQTYRDDALQEFRLLHYWEYIAWREAWEMYDPQKIWQTMQSNGFKAFSKKLKEDKSPSEPLIRSVEKRYEGFNAALMKARDFLLVAALERLNECTPESEQIDTQESTVKHTNLDSIIKKPTSYEMKIFSEYVSALDKAQRNYDAHVFKIEKAWNEKINQLEKIRRAKKIQALMIFRDNFYLSYVLWLDTRLLGYEYEKWAETQIGYRIYADALQAAENEYQAVKKDVDHERADLEAMYQKIKKSSDNEAWNIYEYRKTHL